MSKKGHNILIVGGGFAGVKCARSLAKKRLPVGTTIRLISDRVHFEYHGALYRIVAGHSPLEICLPLRDTIDTKKVDIVEDCIDAIDTKKQSLTGASGSTYDYDTLVLALGSETVYFDVPGLQEHSYGIKTINDALRLKRHIHETIQACTKSATEKKVCGGNFVVIGGGATGVEIAAELAVYGKRVAKKHGLAPALVQVELIEAQSRILSTLPEDFVAPIEAKLRSLGVNIFVNRAVTKRQVGGVMMKDMTMKTTTVIWTAGVRAHHLIEDAGLALGAGKKAIVCSHLKAKGYDNIYIAGDAALTPLSGMAQTALQDGAYIARSIARELHGKKPRPYNPLSSIYAIPVGPGWAGSMWHQIRLYGKLGWMVRRVVDLVVYLALLPLGKVPAAFSAHRRVSESCPACKE